MDSPARPSSAAFLNPGDMIGPYRLLERIGEGGFGTVWLAERRVPIVQRVALKVLNPGMDTREVLARFEQERQALAVMNHPNVAKVFDAGATSAGRPYFAMEHVPGEPITDYCDRHRLSIRQRLELFIPVCEAVQHAHHKGIIHRDIKPSNILVAVHEGRAVPKVIDFGVAKAVSHTLTAKTIFTEHGRLIGTPEYMSPEQAEMGATDVDTRTDVYALGVVLYELLSGLLPFDAATLRAAGLVAICKIIREQEPARPSTRLTTADAEASAAMAASRHTQREALTRELRRELDWIPLKAIRKDRAERYDTPMDLAQDVQRYLNGEPLEAGPESAAYRLRKLVRRYRGPVVAASLLLMVLLLGIATTTWGFVSAAQRAEGERRAKIDAQNKQSLAERKTAEAETAQAAEAEARKTVEYQSYVANVQMAAAAMDFRQFDRVRARLDACPAMLRGWEWRWLNARADNSLLTLTGHTDRLRSAAFSSDGMLIVTASEDGTARVWDAITGASRAVLMGHSGLIFSAAFSPDGSRIVTASIDSTARIWDTATGSNLAVLEGHSERVRAVVFSPDGRRIATASDDSTVRVWDADTGASLAILKGHQYIEGVMIEPVRHTTWKGNRFHLESVVFSPDGKRIATASDDHTARVWDTATGASLAVLTHLGPVYSVAFSPSGTRIVTASGDHTAGVWDATTGTSIAELKGHTASVFSAAFSPDGTRIVTASGDWTSRLWDAARSETPIELFGHQGPVRSVAFSPDGTRIVTASDDGNGRVWDATAVSPLVLKGHTDLVSSAAFSPDGTRIVTASWDGTARVWDSVAGECLVELPGLSGQVYFAAFSPDGTRIVMATQGLITGGGVASVWNAVTGARLVVLQGHKMHVRSAVFSPDGARIVTASSDHTARIWDAVSGASLVELAGHSSDINLATFSPDGMRVVTACDDHTARVWDVTSGACLVELKGHTDKINSAAFSPEDTRIVTASEDQTARVWDAETGLCLAELKGFTSFESAAFSPDGTRIATEAGVWDATTGASLAEFKGHWSAAFSPDGARIVTAYDKTAFVWDSIPYRERYPSLLAFRSAATEMAEPVSRRIRAGEDLDGIAASITHDKSLSEIQKRAGLPVIMVEQHRRFLLAREAESMNSEAWSVVASTDSTPEAVAEALKQAARAAELDPSADIINTLGVAQYRAGRYEDALATLARSTELYTKSGRGTQPADLAFIAMSHFKLGHVAEARSALESLRALWFNTDNGGYQFLDFLEEADALIQP